MECDHMFIEIETIPFSFGYKYIRWCFKCGTLESYVQSDGRTYHYQKLKPELAEHKEVD